MSLDSNLLVRGWFAPDDPRLAEVADLLGDERFATSENTSLVRHIRERKTVPGDMYISTYSDEGAPPPHGERSNKVAEILGLDRWYVNDGMGILIGYDDERDMYSADVYSLYWSNADRIHGWFVKNIQDGVDNSQSYLVFIDDLRLLAEDCRRFLAALDDEEFGVLDDLMPARVGQIKENRMYLQKTILCLETLFAKYELDPTVEFVYTSSW